MERWISFLGLFVMISLAWLMSSDRRHVRLRLVASGVLLQFLLGGLILVGISWNSVIGISAAYTTDRFGLSHLGTIYGTMFAVMPLGSGLGAFLGGLFYDIRGTYDIAIWSNVLLLLAAALLVFSNREHRPTLRESVAAVTSSRARQRASPNRA